jgi:LPXTG-motif cell wall-anchored protein
MSRLGAAALTAAFALSAPAGALAQSAGDEQYRDPFADQDQAQAERDGGGDQGGSSPSAAPAPAPTGTAAPTESTTTAEPIATTADTLPRTGSEAVWVAALGLLSIAAGAGLRYRSTG